jgi:hypothetical protein
MLRLTHHSSHLSGNSYQQRREEVGSFAGIDRCSRARDSNQLLRRKTPLCQVQGACEWTLAHRSLQRAAFFRATQRSHKVSHNFSMEKSTLSPGNSRYAVDRPPTRQIQSHLFPQCNLSNRTHEIP